MELLREMYGEMKEIKLKKILKILSIVLKSKFQMKKCLNFIMKANNK